MTINQKSGWVTGLVAAALSVNMGLATAGEAMMGSGFNKSFNLRLSGYQATTSTDIRVDSNDGIRGGEISFEDDLGLSDRETQPLLDITYRFNPRHMVDFSYVNLSRSGSRVFEKTGIITDDIEWTAGTVLSGSFDSEVYRLSYGYSFINDGKKELGVLIGLHVTRLNITLSGTGSLVAINTTTGEQIVVGGEAARTYDSGFTVPLPVIGLHGS